MIMNNVYFILNIEHRRFHATIHVSKSLAFIIAFKGVYIQTVYTYLDIRFKYWLYLDIWYKYWFYV